ncbi:MAG: HAMP domain-containing protein [Saprospiraceae bacterium]|uniref:histidine kinase n=1 Tax=Candidatus Opimibacter skivensis TaxID=2982028 RepID=A0A9D7SY70_9BACT|nr:HAMP domain-containing protein [Candidatus Opimibacter skivensis]
MKIKTKLSLGVGILFILITVLIIVGVIFINKLSTDTQNILVANYNTIDYSRQMLIALDGDFTKGNSIAEFQKNLNNQQKNITENGEQELTDKLTDDFDKFKNSPGDSLISIDLRKDLTDIMLLNMQAIERKSTIATNTADSATTILAVLGTFCFIIAFTLLLNLPGNISNPIRELTESIKEIADKNYSQRVHFEGHNEFGELAKSFNSMAKKLEEYNNSNLAKLMMEKSRIETLINNMHDPVIGLDENKGILFINNEALKIAGLKYGETIGKKAEDIAVQNDLIRSLVQQMIIPDQTINKNENKLLKIFADGKESYFNMETMRIEIIPTGETAVKYIGDVILLKNITSFKELDAAKTNFIATVSHELKTPISSMLMSLQLLENDKNGTVNETQKQLIESIKEDSARLLKITGELLNMSQVETGNIQLSLQQSDPMRILQYALDSIRTQAEKKNIQLKIDAEKDLPFIKADEEKTSWVLVNLLTNAINYSAEHSEIIVTLNREISNFGVTTVKISVRDFGKGIDSKYKDRIFDRYFQIPGSYKSGSGLGLAISKEFIEAQGGNIALESEVGIGSKFSVTFNSSNS